jgi:hypothetical protein
MTGTVADSSLRSWLQQALGAAPVRQLFERRQTAYVVGYRLEDGRQVVVKARHDPVRRVQACLAVQAGLFASNYPCARPLTMAAIVDGLTVHAEELRDPGDRMRGDDLRTARAFAVAFAGLMGRLERMAVVAEPDVLTPPPWVGWWRQRPWSASPRVPAVIYEAADRVRTRLARYDGPCVLGHADWESQNLRWTGDRLAVAYDWDSLAWLPEAVLVGAAASSFPSDLQPVVAATAASASFLQEYQEARRRELSPDELEVAWAAGLLPVLFNARNEALEGRRPLILPEIDDQVAERLRLAGA